MGFSHFLANPTFVLITYVDKWTHCYSWYPLTYTTTFSYVNIILCGEDQSNMRVLLST